MAWPEVLTISHSSALIAKRRQLMLTLDSVDNSRRNFSVLILCVSTQTSQEPPKLDTGCLCFTGKASEDQQDLFQI